MDFFQENIIFDFKRNKEKELLAYKNSEKSIKIIDKSLNNSVFIQTEGIQMLKLNDQMTKLVTICQNAQNITVWNIEDLNQIKNEPDLKKLKNCYVKSSQNS